MHLSTSPGRKSRGGRPGFSFIELMIAMTVAAAIMAIAFPRLTPVRDSAGVRTSKQVIMSYLATARQSAIRRGSSATFHVNGNAVWVTAPDSTGATQTVEPRVDLLQRNGVTLATTLTSVTFNGRGMAAPRLGGADSLTLSRGASTDKVCVTMLGMVGKCGL